MEDEARIQTERNEIPARSDAAKKREAGTLADAHVAEAPLPGDELGGGLGNDATGEAASSG